MKSLKEVLMEQERFSSAEADRAITYAKGLVAAGEDPEEVLNEEFGLEPDWVMDIL
jgi:hypothetical protein